MLEISNTELAGLRPAIRGMRNPMNSWKRSDSVYHDGELELGQNDLGLAIGLVSGGPVHAKFRRMITVWCDVNAPLYWWKEFDTYKVGTVANSCSTMHKIHAKEFTLDDFSWEHIGTGTPDCDPVYYEALHYTICALNEARRCYLDTKDKTYWWQMIQLLPSSYNQLRTIQTNYEVLANIYKWRRNHKLDEWHTFCDWIERLPYAGKLIIGPENDAVGKPNDKVDGANRTETA